MKRIEKLTRGNILKQITKKVTVITVPNGFTVNNRPLSTYILAFRAKNIAEEKKYTDMMYRSITITVESLCNSFWPGIDTMIKYYVPGNNTKKGEIKNRDLNNLIFKTSSILSQKIHNILFIRNIEIKTKKIKGYKEISVSIRMIPALSVDNQVLETLTLRGKKDE